MVETTRMGSGGRLVIPAAIRKALGLAPGDEIVLVIEQGELRVFSARHAALRAQALVRPHVPKGTSLVEELLAERRDESQRA